MAEKSFEELQAEFIAKIAPYKQGVAQEFLRRKNGYQEPMVVEGLAGEMKAIAERMIALQNEKGYFSKQDMLPSDFTKVQTTAKKYGITNKQAVGLFIQNDRYMSPETVEIENLCNLIEDIFSVYGMHYEKLGAFPVNALNEQSRAYLRNKKIPLGLTDKFKLVLSEYLPELAAIKVVDKSYRAVPRYRFEYNDEIARQMALELKEIYADENGLIDSLFLEKNKTYLKRVLDILSERGISFEQFASKNGLNYTRCYRLESEPAVLHMIENYRITHGTYQGITTKDPYLRQKIDTVEKHTTKFSLAGFLSAHGIENDAFDNGQMITQTELDSREALFFTKMIELYPDMVVGAGFLKQQGKLYEEGLRLASRRGCKSLDEYLHAAGFSRQKTYDKPLSMPTIVLTERDLSNYGFVYGTDVAALADIVEKYGLQVVDVENAKTFYQKLVAERQDSSRLESKKRGTMGED